ncbi:MAG: LCP family protein [Firmicutes bacterium]|nr:LCP family protein [Bacillota bacterium]
MKRGWKIAIAAIAVVVVGGAATGAWYVDKLQRAVQHPEQVLTSMPKKDTGAAEQQTQLNPWNQALLNVAFYGVDTGVDGRDFSSVRTDTIVAMRLDLQSKRVAAISVPRDTYTTLPTGQKTKINAAFPYGGGFKGGGFQASNQAVSELLGVPINNYVGIDMRAVPTLVDAIGGVDVRIDKPLVGHGLNYQPGTYHMNGQQALAYVRWRWDGLGDIGRVERQQRFLVGLVSQMADRHLSPTQLFSLYQSASEAIYTDMPVEKLLAFAQFVETVPTEETLFAQVPGNYWNSAGVSYWKYSPSALQQTMKHLDAFLQTGTKPQQPLPIFALSH